MCGEGVWLCVSLSGLRGQKKSCGEWGKGNTTKQSMGAFVTASDEAKTQDGTPGQAQ